MIICYRCLHVYDLKTAPRRGTKKLKVKEPSCPKCKCKIYFNRNDSEHLSVSFEKLQYTASEE